MGTQLRGRQLGREIVGQMHEHRLQRFVGVVEEIELGGGAIATVYIVKLDVYIVHFQFAQRVRVFTRILFQLAHHYALQRQQQGLFAGIAINGQLFVEMSQCFSIIDGFNFKLFAHAHRRGIVDRCAATTRAHLTNLQRPHSFVLQ